MIKLRSRVRTQRNGYYKCMTSCHVLVVNKMSDKDEDEAPPTPEQLKKDKEIIAKLQSKQKEELKKTDAGEGVDKKKTEDLFEKRLKKSK